VAATGRPGAGADDGAWLCDPEGVGPRLSLLRVPEPKVAKNRLHMDVRVAGATALQPFPGHHVVMADPEGNEFCVS
jgi:Glyoxalase-like domain